MMDSEKRSNVVLRRKELGGTRRRVILSTEQGEWQLCCEGGIFSPREAALDEEKKKSRVCGTHSGFRRGERSRRADAERMKKLGGVRKNQGDVVASEGFSSMGASGSFLGS